MSRRYAVTLIQDGIDCPLLTAFWDELPRRGDYLMVAAPLAYSAQGRPATLFYVRDVVWDMVAPSDGEGQRVMIEVEPRTKVE